MAAAMHQYTYETLVKKKKVGTKGKGLGRGAGGPATDGDGFARRPGCSNRMGTAKHCTGRGTVCCHTLLKMCRILRGSATVF